ncbi:Methionyl-tRNA formyltransferase [Fusarium falciforme]|nr:Methionyl-tRNA formyltransferase [Fusarium falciforme]WAO89659.1 Methionyl-tRNA formyltransferase [Fusarium falciforme]
MLRLLTRSRSLLGRQSFPWRQCYSHAATRSSEPLRILFCGSDDFSCASLKAVYEEHSRNKDLIESLDVMVLPPKRMGRSFKTLREVPCKILAEELGLKIHQRETFTKWELPEATNLVVAVSFGLFVPPRILRSAKYGGLNVHPSLLPDLRGPAPIHHAILRGYQNTGVSLQTLDDKAFDHGTVLAQTPRPGIPIPPGCTVQELTSLLAPIGAQMLVQGLRDGVHIPPHQRVDWKAEDLRDRKLVHAPKVTKADGQINWGDWTADEFVRRVRVLGSIWTHAVNKKGQTKRLIFQDAEVASLMDPAVYGSRMSLHLNLEPGLEGPKYEALVTDQRDGSAIIHIPSGELIWVRKIKEEGKPERDATIVLKSFQ